jgi:hypothetical protein
MLSISLIPEPNESASDQKRRLKLEREIQKQWDEYFKPDTDKDATFDIVSAYFPMVSMWLGSSACGRVLRIRLKSDGRFLDATNAGEAESLIGPGKTLGTLTAAFGLSESFI